MDETKQKPIVKPISFKSINYDCLEHLEKQINRSEYICQLIRLDMEYDILRNRDNLKHYKPVDENKLDIGDTFDF